MCAACGAPYRRIVEIELRSTSRRREALRYRRALSAPWGKRQERYYADSQAITTITTALPPPVPVTLASQPGTVLDPFCGSGTTLLVARELGHHAIGLDLSYPYLHDIARERLGLTALAAWEGRNGHGHSASRELWRFAAVWRTNDAP